MHPYRLSHYDPALRRGPLIWSADDWTAISDIGGTFRGAVLTEAAYLAAEQAHLDVVTALLSEAGVEALGVRDVENHGGRAGVPPDGSELPLDRLPEVVRSLLRDAYWCRLEGTGRHAGQAYVHVSHDYIVFVGVPARSAEAERLAARLGLFLEHVESPYLAGDDDRA